MIFLLACVAITITSCLKDDFVDPKASFELYEVTVDKDGIVLTKSPIAIPAADAENDTILLSVNQPVLFVNTGEGTHFSLWTGDSKHNYFLDSITDTGIDFPIGDGVLYTYSQTGVYDLIMFATSLDEHASKWPRTSITYTVKVVTLEPEG